MVAADDPVPVIRVLAVMSPFDVTETLCAELARTGLAPIGFDVSSGMLAAAHTRVPLVRADVVTLPLADGSVDGATCGFALRNLVDLPDFLAELARVVRLGGRVGSGRLGFFPAGNGRR